MNKFSVVYFFPEDSEIRAVTVHDEQAVPSKGDHVYFQDDMADNPHTTWTVSRVDWEIVRGNSCRPETTRKAEVHLAGPIEGE